jgi:hypothetical protein
MIVERAVRLLLLVWLILILLSLLLLLTVSEQPIRGERRRSQRCGGGAVA